ncbi:hypothetical protein LXL04_014040 [Taraxacum kok-saghyz]
MAATHKTLFIILTYALLEWTLIVMLLLNSLFSFLIRKFATYYALKPPCFWCSAIDHLLEPNNDINPFHILICETHATQLVNLYYCQDRQKVITEPRYVCKNGKCSCCSMKFKENCVDKLSNETSKIKSYYGDHEMVEAMDMENKSRHIQVFDQLIPLEWTDSSTSCSEGSSLNGDEIMVNKDEYQVKKQEGGFLQSSVCKDEEDKAATIHRLLSELKSERLAVCGLYIELNAERNASAIAANQALAMITRLQEDKIALQIESMQNQRMMDEQSEYDREVLQLLNELVMKLENDKIELENELEMYKERFSKAKMKPMCHGASSSDTKKYLDDVNFLDLKNPKTLKESIVEFDVERPWILEKLVELDETLMMRNDLDEDLRGKSSLEEGHLPFKGNIFLRVFDMEGIDEDDEASHSVWPSLEDIKKNGEKELVCETLIRGHHWTGLTISQVFFELEDT